MKSVKAQINQMFIWMVVLLVIAAIALIGVRSIGGLVDDKCTIDKVQFKDDIIDTIKLSNDFGSRSQKQKSLPCDYYKVCFVDARSVEQKVAPLIITSDPTFNEYADLIVDSIESGAQENIFLYNGKEIIPSGYAGELRLNNENSLPDEVLCIDDTSGRATFIVEGLGKNTWIKEKQ